MNPAHHHREITKPPETERCPRPGPAVAAYRILIYLLGNRTAAKRAQGNVPPPAQLWGGRFPG